MTAKHHAMDRRFSPTISRGHFGKLHQYEDNSDDGKLKTGHVAQLLYFEFLSGREILLKISQRSNFRLPSKKPFLLDC